MISFIVLPHELKRPAIWNHNESRSWDLAPCTMCLFPSTPCIKKLLFHKRIQTPDVSQFADPWTQTLINYSGSATRRQCRRVA